MQGLGTRCQALTLLMPATFHATIPLLGDMHMGGRQAGHLLALCHLHACDLCTRPPTDVFMHVCAG